MDDPAFLFPHQVPGFLRISRSEFDLLRKYDSFPQAERVEGACIFFYWKTDINDFLDAFQSRQAFERRIEYLANIDREE